MRQGAIVPVKMCAESAPAAWHPQVKRGRAVVHEGRIASLRRVKDDVKEVAAGLECGMGVEGFTAWKEGDTVQVLEGFKV